MLNCTDLPCLRQEVWHGVALRYSGSNPCPNGCTHACANCCGCQEFAEDI